MAKADWAATTSYKKLGCFFMKYLKANGSSWKFVSLNRLPLHFGDRTVADRLRFVVSAKGVHVPVALDFIRFAVGRCNETFEYVHTDNGTPTQLFPFERPLAESVVQHSTTAGCLRPGPA